MHRFSVTVALVVALAAGAWAHDGDDDDIYSILPELVWDTLSGCNDADLQPWVLKELLLVLRQRSGSEHWCCNHGGGSMTPASPVFDPHGNLVAWNSAPCPLQQLGCCLGYLKVANHCMNKDHQRQFAIAIDAASKTIGRDGVMTMLDVIKKGGELVG